MRHSHAAVTTVTTVAALTAGLTAAVALRRRAGRRLPASALTPAAAPAAAVPAPARDGVVVPFLRPVPAATTSSRPAGPARCGDNGGQTKAGAPCAARATTAGRCHHHHVAA